MILMATGRSSSLLGKANEINDLIVEIGRSSHETYKVFSATGVGGKMLQFAKMVATQQLVKEQTLQRHDQFAKSSEPTMEVLMSLDMDLAPFAYKVFR